MIAILLGAVSPLVTAAMAQGASVAGPSGQAISASDVTADVTGSGSVGIEASIYPGTSGQATCDAPAEVGAMPQGSLAVVKPQYLTVGNDGRVTVVSARQMPCNGYRPAALRQLQSSAKQVFVTVSAGPTPTAAALATPTAMSAAQQAITSFVSQNRLQGAELDFQPTGWSQDLWSSYMTFVSGLSASLGAAGGTLEVDLPGWTSTPPDAERYADPVAAGAKLVVMALDHQYVQACSPIAPYSWLRSVVEYAESQVAASSLVVGIPSYGYIARSCSSITAVRDNVPYVSMQVQPGFPSSPPDVAAHRDPASGEIRWREGQTQYDYVDSIAMRSKLRLIQGLGVTEVSVWSLGGNPWFTGDPGAS